VKRATEKQIEKAKKGKVCFLCTPSTHSKQKQGV